MDDPFASALKTEEPPAAAPASGADPFALALKPKEEYKDDGDQVSRYASRIPPEDPNADQVSRARGKYPEPTTPLFQDIAHRNDLMRIFDVQSQKQAIHNDIAAQYAKEHGIDEPRKWTLKHQHAVNELAEKAFKDSKPPSPDTGMGEVFKQAFEAAVTEPTKFAAEMLKELVANPQYMTPLTAEFGFANAVKNMGKATAAVKATVRAADAGVMGAAITLPGTFARQQLEHGEATLKDTGTDLAMAGLTTAGMQAVVAGAVALGGKIVSKRTGAAFTPENAQKAVGDAAKAIEEGTPSDVAVRQVLDEMKVPEAAADAIEQGVKEAATFAEPPVPEGHTRLWRGEKQDGKGMVGFTVGGSEFAGKEKGLFFAADRGAIERHVKGSSTPEQPLSLTYVDVPTADLPKYRTNDYGPDDVLPEFIVPDALAAKRAKVGGSPKIDLSLEDLPKIEFDEGMQNSFRLLAADYAQGEAPVHAVEDTLRQKMVADINADKGKSWIPLAARMQKGLADTKIDGRAIPQLETLGQVAKIVTDSDMPDMWKVMINAVRGGAEDVPIVFRDLDGPIGKYKFGKNLDEIQIDRKHFNPNKPWEFLQTVIHEGSHARVASTIDMQPHAPPVRALDQLFTYVRGTFRNLDKRHADTFEEGVEPYGFKNLHEFVAEVRSNPKFQDQLRSFELPEKVVKNLQETLGEKQPGLFKTAWNALTALYGKIMGVAPKDMRAFATAFDLVSRLEKYVTPAERQRSNEMFLNTGRVKSLNAEHKVFHGTQQAFDQHGTTENVKAYRAITRGRTDGEFYFTDNPEVAASYADGPGGNVRPEIVDFKNPLVVDAAGVRWDARDNQYRFGTPGTVRKAIGDALDAGHDGVIVKNVRDSVDGSGPTSTVFVAFKQNQIRSALSVGDISPIINNPKNQTGAIDKRLLAAMGLGSASALATWIFTEDPLKSGIAGLAGGALTLAASKPVRSVLQAMGFHADQRFRITDLTDQLTGMIATGELATERMRKKLMTDLGKTSDARFKVLRDWMESDPSTAQGRAFRQANPLTAREQAFINAVETGFDGAKPKLLALGMDPDKFFDQYITHLWVPGINTQKSVWDNLRASLAERGNDASPGMAPHSRFTMRRSIPTYAEGERLGLMPVTNNPAAILQIYLNNVNRALANKQLQGALLRERTPWGERLMVVDMPEPAMREVIKRDAIAARQLQLSPADKKIFQDMHSSIRAPREYVSIDHPQMRGFKVLKDIEAPLKHLFDANDPSVATKMAYAVSVAAKRALFSWSLFHAKSLLDALLGAGPSLVAKLPAAKRALEDAGAAGDAVKELVAAGLRVTGRPIEGDITPFTNALRMIGEKYPVVGAPAKAVNFLTKKMDHFLWDLVHPTFKTAAGLAQFEKELTKRPNVPREQIAKEVASYVNDVFGSVDWFRIADEVSNKYGRDLALAVTSPSGRRFMQIAMLAPDWTVATGRSLLKAVPGISSKEIGAMHRAYFVRSAILYLAVADGLNMAFSGHHIWQNEDPTTVDLDDGRRLQLSKHFMEGIHWLTKPGQQALNKLGYVVSEPLKLAFNQEYLSTKGAPPIVPESKTKISEDPEKWAQEALSNTGTRAMHALKAPLPITLQNSMTNTPGSVVAGFLGFPVLSKNEEQAVQAARERAEKQGKDVAQAERRVRNVYRKKQRQQDALR